MVVTVLSAQIHHEDLKMYTPTYKPQLLSFSRNALRLDRATSAFSMIKPLVGQPASNDWQNGYRC